MVGRARRIRERQSPFEPVTYKGKTFVPGQSNNSYIFPGVGLGVITSEATRVTEEMFFVAAKTLAGMVTEEEYATGRIYPRLDRIREVSVAIAVSVAEVAFRRGLTNMNPPDDLMEHIKARMYDPTYASTSPGHRAFFRNSRRYGRVSTRFPINARTASSGVSRACSGGFPTPGCTSSKQGRSRR